MCHVSFVSVPVAHRLRAWVAAAVFCSLFVIVTARGLVRPAFICVTLCRSLRTRISVPMLDTKIPQPGTRPRPSTQQLNDRANRRHPYSIGSCGRPVCRFL